MIVEPTEFWSKWIESSSVERIKLLDNAGFAAMLYSAKNKGIPKSAFLNLLNGVLEDFLDSAVEKKGEEE